jgi:hypothetical protein
MPRSANHFKNPANFFRKFLSTASEPSSKGKTQPTTSFNSHKKTP